MSATSEFRNVERRDVDKLLNPTDMKIAILDKEYLDKHGIEKLFNELVENLVTLKPLDPLQYVIDSIEFSPQYALQDPNTGLPEHRRAKLVSIFEEMDKGRVGKVSYKGLQEFASRHGGKTLSEEDLLSIFVDFKPQADSLINLDQFLLFFAKVSRTIPNSVFTELVQDMLS